MTKIILVKSRNNYHGRIFFSSEKRKEDFLEKSTKSGWRKWCINCVYTTDVCTLLKQVSLQRKEQGHS